MWMASVSKHERLRWNRTLFGTFGLGACQMAGLPPLAFPGEEETYGVSAKLMAGDVRVFGWSLHTQKYVNGHMNFPDCCCIVRFVSLIWGTLWNDAKNRFALGLCRCLACKHPTLGKDTLCHALAMEHNPKHIFQHIFRLQHIFGVICVALCN